MTTITKDDGCSRLSAFVSRRKIENLLILKWVLSPPRNCPCNKGLTRIPRHIKSPEDNIVEATSSHTSKMNQDTVSA